MNYTSVKLQSMELEHWLWVGVSFGVSLLLVWLVWNFCCGDRLRGAKGEDGDKSEDSDSFSSTHVITRYGNVNHFLVDFRSIMIKIIILILRVPVETSLNFSM